MNVNTAFILRNIYGKHILVPVRKNTVGDNLIVFNDVAARIWELASEGNSKNEIVVSIMQEYGLDENSPQAQSVAEFTDQMIVTGLLIDESEEI